MKDFLFSDAVGDEVVALVESLQQQQQKQLIKVEKKMENAVLFRP